MIMNDIEIPRMKCLRCGHKWFLRRARKPTICPKCKSRYWDSSDAPKRGRPKIPRKRLVRA